MAAVMGLSAETELFERTEAKLTAWAYQCRVLSDRMGLPTSSNGIVKMLDEVREFERKRKDVRRGAEKAPATVKRGVSRQCPTCELIYLGAACPKCDPKKVAIALGNAERTLTARGKQTRASERPDMELGGEIARVDYIVRNLAGWMKAAIFRSYLYAQPDRIAAHELKMPREEFTSRRRAAVACVAMLLAQRREIGL